MDTLWRATVVAAAVLFFASWGAGCDSDDKPASSADAATAKDRGPAADASTADLAQTPLDQAPATPDTGPAVDLGPSPDHYPLPDGRTGKPGELCEYNEECQAGLVCSLPLGATLSFCSTACQKFGQSCQVSGTDAHAICVKYPNDIEAFCTYFCRADGQEYTCPGSLRCSPVDVPPGSGDFPCVL